MAILDCPKCGAPCSDQARFCRKCGWQIRPCASPARSRRRHPQAAPRVVTPPRPRTIRGTAVGPCVRPVGRPSATPTVRPRPLPKPKPQPMPPAPAPVYAPGTPVYTPAPPITPMPSFSPVP